LAYLLDTNILIAAIKGRPEVVDRLRTLDAAELLLSAVVLGEVETGVSKSSWPQRRSRDRSLRAGGDGVGCTEFTLNGCQHRTVRWAR
jgi:predicted nucleic acid-binding protein